MATPVDDPATRAWRLTAWARKELHSTTVVHGDRALDAAMRPLEADPRVTKIAVTPA